MQTLPRIAWLIDVGSQVLRVGQVRPHDSGATGSHPLFPSLASIAGRGRLDSVTLEVGHDDASIVAIVYADGKLRLAFGSGHEFVGCCEDLPASIGAAARNLLDVAAPAVRRLPQRDPADPRGWGTARMTLRTSKSVRTGESRVTDLENGRSSLTPLWRAFSDLLGPMVVALFETPLPADRARRDTPGLHRARRLWVERPEPPSR